MNKLDSIVVSNTEPNSKNVLWYDNKRLLIFSNGHWSPIVDLDDIDVDNFPNISNLQEALKSLNIKVDNKVDKVEGKGLSTNDYTDNEKSKLSTLPTATELDATLTAKQDKLVNSADVTVGEDDKLALTTPAKYSAFDDVWVRLCSTYGGLDYSHTENNIAKPYRLNGLWLTRNEAIDIVMQYRTWGTAREDVSQISIRTNIPLVQSSAREYSNSYNQIEVANLVHCYPLTVNACFSGGRITSIINFNAQYLQNALYESFSAPNLVTLDISNLKISLDLSKCPLINLTSWLGLVSRAANTDTITITVHPDVYAKLTGDTTNSAAAALTAKELAQWQQLVTDATSKNINFATPE